MSKVIEKQILTKVKKAKRGSVVFTKDFLQFGNSKTISKTLERLVKKKQLTRVAHGIYALLKKHPLLGELHPPTENLAIAIAKRDKARIIPTGVTALHALGLSTQVPMNLVYLTDGAARNITLGNKAIKFKKTSPKNLAAIGKISSLAIQALKEIGKDNIEPEEEKKIITHLKTEDKYRLEHDIKLAPEWIRIIMRKAL